MVTIPSASRSAFLAALAAAIAPAGGTVQGDYVTGVAPVVLKSLAAEFAEAGAMTTLVMPPDGPEMGFVELSQLVTWVDAPAQAPVIQTPADETLPDISGLSLDAIRRLQAAINGRITELTAGSLIIWTGDRGDVADRPAGGAVLGVRMAAGGNYDHDEWYPSVDAAKAALLGLAQYHGRVPSPNGLFVDLTSPGCHSSRAWIE